LLDFGCNYSVIGESGVHLAEPFCVDFPMSMDLPYLGLRLFQVLTHVDVELRRVGVMNYIAFQNK
jgi:hypothetical protein